MIFSTPETKSVQYKTVQNAPVDNSEESQVVNTVEVSFAKAELKNDPNNNVKALQVTAL